MNLLQLQQQMAADVSRPLTPGFAMQSQAENGEATSQVAERYIKPNSRLSSGERLEIYNRQYWFRVIAAVAEDFPALRAVLGEKKFDRLTLAYLRDHPSTSFTLRDLGARLPQWLATHPEFTLRRHKLALDVARLEWAYVEAFDSAQSVALDTADLMNLGPESTLSLQPHVQLLDLHYPVDELVLAVRRQQPVAEITSNATSQPTRQSRLRLPATPLSAVFLAVHRFEEQVYYRRLERPAFLLLVALQKGASLMAAMETAFAGFSPEEQATAIQDCFAHAAQLGWFCRPTL